MPDNETPALWETALQEQEYQDMPAGKASIKTTIWLGNDQASMDGYGFGVHREDDMVAIEAVAEGGMELEVFIQPDLFPAIRRVMDSIGNSRE